MHWRPTTPRTCKAKRSWSSSPAPFGIASLECALGLYVKALIEPEILDWPGLIRLMTVNPARIIGIDKGTLTRGKQGDVTIIDPNAEWQIDVQQIPLQEPQLPLSRLDRSKAKSKKPSSAARSASRL